jgi:hypothetical protein
MTTTTYDENVESAIAANDIDTLIRYAYGSPCLCKTIKGEPLCICKMQEKALRAKVVPVALFQNTIERVTSK